MSDYAEENAHLLYRLRTDIGAKGFGSIANFFNVSHSWRCPCCLRSKQEIARLDKNENMLCAIHSHHDHFLDIVHDRVRTLARGNWEMSNSIVYSLQRFPETMICNDCNVAEPVAKLKAGAPEAFSFAPHEIASFIVVTANEPHTVDPDRAQIVYEAVVPSMKILAERLREITKAVQSNGETFEPLGAAAWRVLKSINEKIKDGL